MWWLLAFGVLIVLVAMLFNRLISLQNRSAAAWSDIDVQLKRRHDLVGNLVDTVKAYAAHEAQTLQQVTDARATAESATGGGPRAAGQAEDSLTGQLRTMFAVAENYPELKASQNYQDLQRSLEALEDAIQNARRYYNAVVRDFNTRIQSVPDLVVARAFGFTEREFFGLDDPAEASVPQTGL